MCGIAWLEFWTESWLKTHPTGNAAIKFNKNCFGVNVPSESITEILAKIILLRDIKDSWRRRILTEAKLNEIGFSYKEHHESLLTRLTAQYGESMGFVRTTRHLKLQPYKPTAVQRLTNPHSGDRIRFCQWLLGPLHNEIVRLGVLIFIEKVWLHLSGYLNT